MAQETSLETKPFASFFLAARWGGHIHRCRVHPLRCEVIPCDSSKHLRYANMIWTSSMLIFGKGSNGSNLYDTHTHTFGDVSYSNHPFWGFNHFEPMRLFGVGLGDGTTAMIFVCLGGYFTNYFSVGMDAATAYEVAKVRSSRLGRCCFRVLAALKEWQSSRYVQT